jgi:hypothetical protein
MSHGIVKCQICDDVISRCRCNSQEVTYDVCLKCKISHKDAIECMEFFYERNKIISKAYETYDYETARKIVKVEMELMEKKFEEVKNRKVLDRKDIHCTFYKKDCIGSLCSADNSSDKKDCRFAEMKNG